MARDLDKLTPKVSAEEQAKKLKAKEIPLGPDHGDVSSARSPIGWQTGIGGSAAARDSRPSEGQANAGQSDGLVDRDEMAGTRRDTRANGPVPTTGVPDANAWSGVRDGRREHVPVTDFRDEQKVAHTGGGAKYGGDRSARQLAAVHQEGPALATAHAGVSARGGAHGSGGGGASDKGNTPALIAGLAAGDIDEDGKTDTIHGQLFISDPDPGQSQFRAETIAGKYGSLQIGLDGKWTYTLDNSLQVVQQLSAGELAIDTLTVSSADGTTRDIVITLHGTEDAPVLVAQTKSAIEDGSFFAGQMFATDADHGDSLHFHIDAPVPGFSMAPDGTYTFDPGNPAYDHLIAGKQQIVSIPVTVTDSQGVSDRQILQITVTGTNDGPVLAIQPSQHVLEGTPAYGGRLAATDPDTGDTLTFAAGNPVAGFHLSSDGYYTFDPADPAYDDLGFNQHRIVSIPVTVTDSAGATDTRTIEITVTGTNDRPVLSIVPPQSVTEGGGAVYGQLTANDPDSGDVLIYSLDQPVPGFVLLPDGHYIFGPSDRSYDDIPAGQTRDVFVPVVVTDRFGATDRQTLKITVTGTNDIPVVGGIDHSIGSVAAAVGGRINIAGTLAVFDVDQGENQFRPQVLLGSYGHLSIDASGKWAYTADTAQPAITSMPQGQHLEETFTVLTADGTSHDIHLQIRGANTPAVIVGTTQGLVTEDSVGSITRNLVIHDLNAGEAAFVPIDSPTQYGHFSLHADGEWTYTIDNGNPAVQALPKDQHLTESLIVSSLDGTPQMISVTIIGTNDVPVFGGVSAGAVTEDQVDASGHLTVSDTLTISDADTGESRFLAITGFPGDHGLGTFSIDASGHWTYTADNSQATIQALRAGDPPLTDSFTTTSADGTRHTVTVTIRGTDDAPVLQAQSLRFAEDDLVYTGRMTAVDADGHETATFSTMDTVAGFTLHADGTYSFDPGNAAYQSLRGGEPKVLTVHVTVTDAEGLVDTQDLTLTVTGTNDAPVVTAIAGSPVDLHETQQDTSETFPEADLLRLVGASDVDGTPAIAAIHVDPQYGAFAKDASGNWVFTPTPGVHHDDIPISIDVTDGTATTTAHALIDVKLPPLIGNFAGDVTEDGITTVVGDIRSGAGTALHFGDHLMTGTYGSLDLRDGGHWIYTLKNDGADVQGLKDGETRDDRFTVTAPDGATHDIVVTVTGTHDQPVITVTGAAPETIESVAHVTDISAATDLSMFLETNTGVATGMRIIGLYMPGSSVNELAGIDAAQLPTTHAAYDMGNAAAAGCGYQYLSGHGWFEQHLSGGADRFRPLAPSIRNTWDGGIVVFQDGTVGRLIKVCDDPRASGPGDYIYFKMIPGVNANQGFTRIVGTAQPNTAVAVYDGQTLLGTVHSDADGHWSYGAVGLADGDHHMHTLAGGTTSATMLVHVAGDRVTVTAEAAALGGVIEDDAAHASASGQLVVNDADLGDNPVFVAQQDVHGAYGTFSIDAQGHWTYTLDNGAAATQSLTDGQHETETFQVAVTTDSGEHAVRDVTVTVTGTKDLPTATAASVAMDEDHSYTFSASDFGFADVDAGATLDHVTILSLPTAAEGQLLLNGQAVSANQQIDTADIPHLVFQPAADFNGNVAFRYAVSDGSADSAPVSGTLVVRPVDDPSQITGDDQVDIFEGAGATSHPDLTVQKGAWIANGVPHDTLPQVTPGDPSTGRWYTTGGTDKDVHVDGMPGTLHFPSGFWLMNMGDPSYGFHGWQLFPRSGTSATAQYSAVPVDAEGDLQIQDIDSPTPTFTNVDSQLGDNGYGTFSMHGGHWTFVTNDKAEALPDGVSATETITFQASDGTTHTVTVRITGSDAASRIEGDLAASIMESRTGTDVQAQGVLTVVDPDTGENPTLPDFSDQVGDNGYGHFSMTNGHWTYVLDPAASDRMQAGIDYQDQITIRASDGREQTIVISITGTNDAPTVTATSISSAEDTVHTFSAADFGFNDPDSNDTLDHVTITGLPDPAQGQLLLDGQAVTQGDQIAAANISKLELRPAQDFNGDATFRYTVSDSHQATSAEATGTITVNAVNDAPVVTANDAAHAVNMGVAAEDTTQTFSEADLLRLAGATDIDGDTLSISAVHIDPAFGSFASDGHGTWTFTPAANVHRDDIEITITVSDQHTTTDAHALLDITPVTDAPTPTLTVTAQQQVMEFAPNSASGVVTDGTVSAGGGMTALTVDMTILGGQQVATSAGHGATFISYATPSDSNAMYIWKPEDLTFRIGGHEYPTGVALMNDGADHRYTFSWDGAHGTLDVLIDGQAVKHLTGIGQGVTLADGGKFALGNDQDSFGGGFSTGDAFTGKMFNVAIAKAAIDPTRLQDAPLGTLLQGDADLLTDVRVQNGQFHDATGNSQYHAVGQVHTTTVEVDTSIASPNPGASLSLDFSAGAPADTTDTVTAQRVFGFPAGTIVTDGHGHTVTVVEPGAVIDLAGWKMDSVQAQLPPAYRGNMNIGYAVTTTGPDGSPETAGDHSPVILDPTQPVPNAVIQGDDAEATDEDTAVSGHLSITDTDTGEAHFVAQGDTDGHYGHFSLAEDGHWTYTPDDRADALAAGDHATETFIARSADGSTHQVAVSLTGTDDAPQIDASDPPPADLGLSASHAGAGASGGMIRVTDPDGIAPHLIEDTGAQGTYGTFDIHATGMWTYTPDPTLDASKALGLGQTGQDHMTVHFSDGTTHELTVEVKGADLTPPASADEAEVGSPLDDYMLFADTSQVGSGDDVGSASGNSDATLPVDDYLAAAGVDSAHVSGSSDSTIQDAPMPDDMASDGLDINAQDDPNVDDALIDMPDPLIEEDPQHHDV